MMPGQDAGLAFPASIGYAIIGPTIEAGGKPAVSGWAASENTHKSSQSPARILCWSQDLRHSLLSAHADAQPSRS
jgi:hypothetical protein